MSSANINGWAMGPDRYASHCTSVNMVKGSFFTLARKKSICTDTIKMLKEEEKAFKSWHYTFQDIKTHPELCEFVISQTCMKLWENYLVELNR